MIQRCPQCGLWCKTEKKGIIDRAVSSWNEAVENDAVFAEKLSNKIGLKKVGGIFGGAFGSYRGMVNGVFNGLLGSKYQFICPICGCEWETENEDEDQTSEYNHEKEMHALLAPEEVKKFVLTKDIAELEKIAQKWQKVGAVAKPCV